MNVSRMILLGISLLCGLPVFAEDVYQQIELERAERDKQEQRLRTNYVGVLKELEKVYTKEGDLEGVLEIGRAIDASGLDQSLALSTHEGVARLQRIFISRLEVLSGEMEHRIDLVKRAAIKKLEKKVERLVQAGKIDQALDRRQEIRDLKVFAEGGGTVRGELRRGLELYWTFDDDEKGMATDQSGHGHDGKLFGQIFYAQGVHGLGIRIHEAKDYIECQNRAFTINGWKGLSLSFWINMMEKTTYGTVLSKVGYPPNYKHNISPRACLGLSLGGQIADGMFSCGGTDSFVFNTYSRARPQHPYPTLGFWQHVLVTTDGKTGKFYFNGELDTEHKFKTPVDRLAEPQWYPLTLGKYRGHRETWLDSYPNAVLDEVMIWSRPLSAEEAKDIHDLHAERAKKQGNFRPFTPNFTPKRRPVN